MPKYARFTPIYDIILLREVSAIHPDTPAMWDLLHKNVNVAIEMIKPDESIKNVRACKDRIKTLKQAFKKQELDSLRASGTEEEYLEREQLLTELQNIDEEKSHQANKGNEKKCDEVIKETQGKIIRQQAMEVLSKKQTEVEKRAPKRQRTNNTNMTQYLEYLTEKNRLEAERIKVERERLEAQSKKEAAFIETLQMFISEKMNKQ